MFSLIITIMVIILLAKLIGLVEAKTREVIDRTKRH